MRHLHLLPLLKSSPPSDRPISEDVRARGFTVVVDMRGSKWESVKPVLRTLQESFSSNIHTALLIKPDTFWQKHKTNLGSAKLSFEVSLAAALLAEEMVPLVFGRLKGNYILFRLPNKLDPDLLIPRGFWCICRPAWCRWRVCPGSLTPPN